MERESRKLWVADEDKAVLSKLVADELVRKLAAIEDLIVSGMGSYSSKWATESRDAVKVAVLELVRSPLADLERTLGAEPVKVVDPPGAKPS